MDERYEDLLVIRDNLQYMINDLKLKENIETFREMLREYEEEIREIEAVYEEEAERDRKDREREYWADQF